MMKMSWRSQPYTVPTTSSSINNQPVRLDKRFQKNDCNGNNSDYAATKLCNTIKIECEDEDANAATTLSNSYNIRSTSAESINFSPPTNVSFMSTGTCDFNTVIRLKLKILKH